MELPACVAVIVQVPDSKPVTVLPETEQIVGVTLLLKVTVRPELAVELAVVVPPTTKVVGVKVTVPIV